MCSFYVRRAPFKLTVTPWPRHYSKLLFLVMGLKTPARSSLHFFPPVVWSRKISDMLEFRSGAWNIFYLFFFLSWGLRRLEIRTTSWVVFKQTLRLGTRFQLLLPTYCLCSNNFTIRKKNNFVLFGVLHICGCCFLDDLLCCITYIHLYVCICICLYMYVVQIYTQFKYFIYVHV